MLFLCMTKLFGEKTKGLPKAPVKYINTAQKFHKFIFFIYLVQWQTKRTCLKVLIIQLNTFVKEALLIEEGIDADTNV